MVWKRKKTTVTVGGSDTASLASAANLVVHESSTGETEPSTPVSSVLNQTTNNSDSLGGVWASKAPEFQMPVRSRPSLKPYVIPANYKISGNIFSDRAVLVFGQFAEGEIEAPTVTVEPGGTLNGGVHVQTLRIAGTSDAVVSASTGVEVSSRGTLRGRIVTPAIKIWPGATLLGAQIEVEPSQPV
jgi:cytoskeletal protein CcmA (bactofilin family)